jgi:hypothetical protein
MTNPVRDYSNIEFVDDQEREYFARATLGIDIEDFLRSNIGRLLHGRARQEVTECQALALECNPNSWFGRRKLTKLRERAASGQLFMRWCADAILDGRHAANELENRK